MAENISHMTTDAPTAATLDIADVNAHQAVTPSSTTLPDHTSTTPIIWTPTFIVTFALLVAVGFSLASIFTQIDVNSTLNVYAVLLVYTLLLLVAWIAVMRRARSFWIRLGALFSCAWTILTGTGFLLGWLAVSAHSPLLAHTSAGANAAFLAAAICLSSARTPLLRWDAWFFRIAPGLSIILIAGLYLLLPTNDRSFGFFESITAGVALYLSIAVWWLRPSCWRSQPGPTLLLGLSPAVLLLLGIPRVVSGGTTFFFVQVILLLVLFAALRIWHYERRHSLTAHD